MVPIPFGVVYICIHPLIVLIIRFIESPYFGWFCDVHFYTHNKYLSWLFFESPYFGWFVDVNLFYIRTAASLPCESRMMPRVSRAISIRLDTDCLRRYFFAFHRWIFDPTHGIHLATYLRQLWLHSGQSWCKRQPGSQGPARTVNMAAPPDAVYYVLISSCLIYMLCA